MKLNIGQSITETRKNMNITQEQLAKMVGVSAPAVSKWETGASYPDITMLPSLARALDTSVDALLRYEKQLTEEQVNDLETQIARLMDDGEIQQGFDRCEQLLKEYPNSVYLKFRIGAVYQRYGIYNSTSDEELMDMYSKAGELFEKVAASGDEKLAPPAKLVLLNYYIVAERLEEAESLLDQIPDTDVNKMQAKASLFLAQKEYSKAKEQNQRILLHSITNAQLALTGLMTIAKREEDYEKAKYINKKAKSLNRLFDMEDIAAYINEHELLMANGEDEAAIACFEKLVDKIIEIDDSFYDHSSKPLFNKIKQNNTHAFNAKHFREIYYLALQERSELMNSHLYSKAINKLREHI